MQKIKSLSSLSKTVEKLKKEGKKIVLCHGVFDLLHPGHIRHFASAKKYGDILLVTITADKFVKKGPGRPIFRQELRAEVLSSLTVVDYIAILNSDSAIDAIQKIKPNFYVKGPDYKKRKPTVGILRKLADEEKAIKEVGGKIIFTDDEIIFSSSKLINEHLSVYPAKTQQYLNSFKLKHPAESIFESLSNLRKLKVLFIGDAIIDQLLSSAW
jgi:rfaE bifunctional protein nucleotidyltransferase chain/domain